jgi:hypothetical protein
MVACDTRLFQRERGPSVSWGRGFFRAWLVLSAIWIGLAVYIAKPLTFSWLWKAPKYEITSVQGQ